MTGAELIAKERQEQIAKHGFNVIDDIQNNDMEQLKWVAESLLTGKVEDYEGLNGWDESLFHKIMAKTEVERLAIAGDLIAAEIDRLNAINKE